MPQKQQYNHRTDQLCNDGEMLASQRSACAQSLHKGGGQMVTGEDMKNHASQQKVSCAVYFLCSTLGVFIAIANNEVDQAAEVHPRPSSLSLHPPAPLRASAAVAAAAAAAGSCVFWQLQLLLLLCVYACVIYMV